MAKNLINHSKFEIMETNFEFWDRLVDNKNSIARSPKKGFKQNLLNLYAEPYHTVFNFIFSK